MGSRTWRSVTGAAPVSDGDTTVTPPLQEPNLLLWAVIGIVVALVVVLVVFIYRKTVVHGEATWESLGV